MILLVYCDDSFIFSCHFSPLRLIPATWGLCQVLSNNHVLFLLAGLSLILFRCPPLCTWLSHFWYYQASHQGLLTLPCKGEPVGIVPGEVFFVLRQTRNGQPCQLEKRVLRTCRTLSKHGFPNTTGPPVAFFSCDLPPIPLCSSVPVWTGLSLGLGTLPSWGFLLVPLSWITCLLHLHIHFSEAYSLEVWEIYVLELWNVWKWIFSVLTLDLIV